MPRVVLKPQSDKKMGVVIPIRIPLDEQSGDIVEIPIRLVLSVSFYRVKHISEQMQTPTGEVMPHLTERQNEVLTAILKDRPNKQIASELNITVRTVKAHISDLFRIFKVSARGELRTAICGRVKI